MTVFMIIDSPDGGRSLRGTLYDVGQRILTHFHHGSQETRTPHRPQGTQGRPQGQEIQAPLQAQGSQGQEGDQEEVSPPPQEEGRLRFPVSKSGMIFPVYTRRS